MAFFAGDGTNNGTSPTLALLLNLEKAGAEERKPVGRLVTRDLQNGRGPSNASSAQQDEAGDGRVGVSQRRTELP